MQQLLPVALAVLVLVTLSGAGGIPRAAIMPLRLSMNIFERCDGATQSCRGAPHATELLHTHSSARYLRRALNYLDPKSLRLNPSTAADSSDLSEFLLKTNGEHNRPNRSRPPHDANPVVTAERRCQ